jgi:hypothetical protein
MELAGQKWKNLEKNKLNCLCPFRQAADFNNFFSERKKKILQNLCHRGGSKGPHEGDTDTQSNDTWYKDTSPKYLSFVVLNIMTFSKTKLSIMTLSIMTLNITKTRHSDH